MSATTMVLQVGGQVRGTAVLNEGASFGALCQEVMKCAGLSQEVIALEMFYAQGQSKLVKTDIELSQVMGMLQANFVVVEVVCGAAVAAETSSDDDAFVFVKMKKAFEENSPAEDDSDSDSDGSSEEDSDDDKGRNAEMAGEENKGPKSKGQRKKEFILIGVEHFKASFQSQDECLAFLAFAGAKRGKAKKFGLELSKDTPKMEASAALGCEDVLLATFVVIQAPLGLVLKKLGLKPKQLNKVGLMRLAQVFVAWRRGKRRQFEGQRGRHGPHWGPGPHHHQGPPFGPPPRHHHQHHRHEGHHGPPHDHHHQGPPFGPHPHHHGRHGHHHHGPPPFGPPHHHHHHHHRHGGHGPWGPPPPWEYAVALDERGDVEDMADSDDEPEHSARAGFAGFGGFPFGPGGLRGRGGMRKRAMMHHMGMLQGHGPRGSRGRGNKLGGPNKRMARLVRHKTMMDGATVPVDAAFTKTWVVRNDSENQWPGAAQLVHIGGDDMGGAMAQVVGPLKPGEECEVSIAGLKAPPLPGLYKSFYRFESDQGSRFGQRLWCSILAE